MPCANSQGGDHLSVKVRSGLPLHHSCHMSRSHSATEHHRGRQPNRRERMAMILQRDGNDCVWCRRTFDDRHVVPTTEHLVPRIKGGPSWIENEVAACKRCNNERGHRTLGEFADECEGLAREPDIERIIRSLESLQAVITSRGGQRRARPYVATQLRRLRRR